MERSLAREVGRIFKKHGLRVRRVNTGGRRHDEVHAGFYRNPDGEVYKAPTRVLRFQVDQPQQPREDFLRAYNAAMRKVGEVAINKFGFDGQPPERGQVIVGSMVTTHDYKPGKTLLEIGLHGPGTRPIRKK